MRYVILAVLFLGLCVTPAPGQFAAGPPDGWYDNPAVTPGQYNLYQGGVFVGALRHADGVYLPFDPVTRTWGNPCQPPIAAPGIARNFGVDTARLAAPGRNPRYKVFSGGKLREVKKDEAYRIYEKQLEDDSKKLRLVVIGSEAECAPVLADAKRDLKGVVIQDYRPDHWHVAKAGFKCDGRPSIYLLQPRPDGKGHVLHRQSGYEAGDMAYIANSANGGLEAKREPDPTYNPAKDPDLRKLFGSGLSVDTSVVLALGLLGGICYLVLTRKKG